MPALVPERRAPDRCKRFEDEKLKTTEKLGRNRDVSTRLEKKGVGRNGDYMRGKTLQRLGRRSRDVPLGEAVLQLRRPVRQSEMKGLRQAEI